MGPSADRSASPSAHKPVVRSRYSAQLSMHCDQGTSSAHTRSRVTILRQCTQPARYNHDARSLGARPINVDPQVAHIQPLHPGLCRCRLTQRLVARSQQHARCGCGNLPRYFKTNALLAPCPTRSFSKRPAQHAPSSPAPAGYALFNVPRRKKGSGLRATPTRAAQHQPVLKRH